jgi:hypothetical protein
LEKEYRKGIPFGHCRRSRLRIDYRSTFTYSLLVNGTALASGGILSVVEQKVRKESTKGCGLWNLGAPVSEAVCLGSAPRGVFYSLGLSPPGFAENVGLLTRLGPDRTGVRRYLLRVAACMSLRGAKRRGNPSPPSPFYQLPTSLQLPKEKTDCHDSDVGHCLAMTYVIGSLRH